MAAARHLACKIHCSTLFFVDTFFFAIHLEVGLEVQLYGFLNIVKLYCILQNLIYNNMAQIKKTKKI